MKLPAIPASQLCSLQRSRERNLNPDGVDVYCLDSWCKSICMVCGHSEVRSKPSDSKLAFGPQRAARQRQMFRSSAMNGNAEASTSTSTAQQGFAQQEDFISFGDILGDDRGSSRENGELGGFRRGQKRSIGQVLEDKGKKRLQDVEKTTPWTANVDWDRYASATDQLSAEIKAFAQYISPTDQEHDLRSCVVESVRRLITNRWRDARVHAFGSFETRLYLPTGDIDLVVVSPSIPSIKTQQKKILYAISGLLTSSGIGKDVIVIAKAKVPIVKFISVQGGFKIDISLNMTNGLNVSKRVNDLFKQVGEDSARALVQVVKAFLNQRNMNEVYSGGLGSYSIILLVVSFLQMHPKLQAKEIRAYDNLGTLLIEFLEVYGKNFNFDDVGICVSGSGSYYSKVRRGWARPNQPYLLSIEDPADPTNDVAGGSHNILAVRQSLGGAYEVLTASLYYRTSIILARIAAVQQGVQLNTLSGRAIPHATGEESQDIDECRKSLLGAILGVTTDIEKSRKEIKALSDNGRVQRSVGMPIHTYDEFGMNVELQAKKGQSLPDGHPPTAYAAAPPLPPLPAEQPPPPPPPTTSKHPLPNRPSWLQGVMQKADSQKENQAPAVPASKAQASKVIEIVSSPEPPSKRLKPDVGFINLDSPSPETRSKDLPNTSVNGQEDSRYSVKKGKQRVQQPEKISYVVPDSSDSSEEGELLEHQNGNESSSDEDSSLIISADDEEDQHLPPLPAKSKRKNGNAESQKAEVTTTPTRPRTRSRTKSASQTADSAKPVVENGNSKKRRRRRAGNKGNSDMDTASSTSSIEIVAKVPDVTKPTRPNAVRSRMSNQKKKEFWSAKGQREAIVNSSDDSDSGSYVVSK